MKLCSDLPGEGSDLPGEIPSNSNSNSKINLDLNCNISTSASPKVISTNSKSLSILHLNVQSLPNKINLIEVLLATEWIDIDILCFSEHWLSADELNLTSFPNFHLASSYCRNSLTRGGVCIYVKHGVDFVPGRVARKLNIDKDFEFTYIVLPKLDITIICIYRTPDANFKTFLTNLELLLNAIHAPNISLVLGGDFNIDFLKNSKDYTKLTNLITNYNLMATVFTPTRITANSKTGLDQIFINSRYPSTTKVLNAGFSDHFAQHLIINMDINSTPTRKIKLSRSFNEVNTNTMITLLKNESWITILAADNVNSKFKNFLETFLHYFDMAFPLTVKKANQYPSRKSWITKGILISCRKKRLLNDISKYCKLPNFLSYFKRYKSTLNKVIKKAKETRNDEFINSSKNKTKALWNVVKQETGKIPSPVQNIQLLDNHTLVNDPLDNANIFNKYFTGIADLLLANSNFSNPTKIIGNFPNSMFLREIEVLEVWNIIQNLKNNFSAGIDNIPNAVIKKCASSIVIPLTHIFNQSFTEGTFPDSLKIAKIIPLHKKGNSNQVENYRPISLLTGFSKILEKLMFNRLCSFIDSNNILTSAQHGFRRGRSTDTATYDFLNHILEAIDNKDITTGLFLDLSKAFDLINHNLLLSKLESYGIRDCPNRWLKSYLSNRKQAVELKFHTTHSTTNHLSDFETIKHGVPQGSILGPLLFLLYINDIVISMNSHKVVLFADDTSVLFSNENAAMLQADIDLTLKELSKWFENNRIIINTSKTVSVNFHAVQNVNYYPASMNLNDSLIDSVTETKFLGIWIQDTIKWSTHIANLSSKLNSSSYAIRILSKSTSLHIRRVAYFAYFHSILKYGIIFWGNAPESITIFRIQKRTLRSMLGAKKLESCKPLFKQLNIMPLPCIYIFEVLLFVMKNMNSIDSFHKNHQIHNYNTRQCANLHLEGTRTNLCKSGVLHTGITLYNNLPNHIKIIGNFKQFKLALRSFLLSNLFYSVNDFLKSAKG